MTTAALALAFLGLRFRVPWSGEVGTGVPALTTPLSVLWSSPYPRAGPRGAVSAPSPTEKCVIYRSCIQFTS